MSDFDVPDVVDRHEPHRGEGRGDAIDMDTRLRQLEQMVAEAKPVPLSSSIMLGRAEAQGMVADIRSAMPEELRQARWVVKEREEVIESAHAERIVEEARSERARLISRTEVVEAANREAGRIVDDAQERARQMRLDADDYVDGKLANFEIVLNKTLDAVHKGRDRLRDRLHGDELVQELSDADGT
jgi:cell division septum initiation protein DivIVA